MAKSKRLFTLFEDDFKGSVFLISCKCGGVVKYDQDCKTITCGNCSNSVTPQALVKNLELF